ncbi:MAG: GNAT family N-acetyltransferase [Dissulfuribacterales bacterium]
MIGKKIAYRRDVVAEDCERIRDLVTSSRFFSTHEIDVAAELVEERLSKGLQSGYHFLFAEDGVHLLGYTCYGPIACTKDRFDLYWIVVQPQLRGKGLGRRLLAETEILVRGLGGERIYVETSSREQYSPTRGFYVTCGYELCATLKGFYGEGDDKMIYMKTLSPSIG